MAAGLFFLFLLQQHKDEFKNFLLLFLKFKTSTYYHNYRETSKYQIWVFNIPSSTSAMYSIKMCMSKFWMLLYQREICDHQYAKKQPPNYHFTCPINCLKNLSLVSVFWSVRTRSFLSWCNSPVSLNQVYCVMVQAEAGVLLAWTTASRILNWGGSWQI